MEIRKAVLNDISSVCKMFTLRMKDSVESSYSLAGINDKEKIFSEMITVQIEETFRVGEIWIAGEFQGALAGHYGKNFKLLNALRSAVRMNKSLHKYVAKDDLAQFAANMKKIAGTQNTSWRKKVCGSKNYFYIQLVAIDERLKGQGVFRQLIDPILMRMKSENVPTLIDTHDKDNIPIYEHFGFELVKKHQAKNGESIYQYSMIKRP